MTLTPLHGRPSTRPIQRTIHPSRPARTNPGAPTLTLTIEVTISGDGPDPETRQLLHDLRRVAERGVAAGSHHTAISVAPVAVSASDATTTTAATGALATSTAARLTAAEDETRVLRIDAAARTVRQGDRTLLLSRLEFELLLFLAEHPGRVFTRDDLLMHVWGYLRDTGRTVDVHVRRLRVKSGEVPLVTTVRGVGYRLAEDARIVVENG